MRLEGALYSSREGITSHGQAISVVADNLSNSSTVGFKRSRTEFADLMAEGYEGRQSETEICGAGVAISEVRPIHETGILEPTGRSLDAGIDGLGFFMVGDEASTYYTRAGNFQMRSDGMLSTSDGLAVLGYQGSATTGTLGPINLLDIKTGGQASSVLTIYGNNDASQAIKTAPSSPATFADLAKAASGISVVEIYDSLGAVHSITIASTKTAAGQWNVQAYIDDGEVSGGTPGTPRLLGQVDLGFGSDGVIPEANKAAAKISIPNVQFANGATGPSAGTMSIDFSNYTQFAAPAQVSGITKDGQSAGQVKGYEIRQNGEVRATLDTGSSVLLGTIQLANFNNVDGLQRIGNSLYSATSAAGERSTGSPGTSTLGKLAGASLERSTVDIANEFIDLVVYQRGYQANSQMLSATTQMIKDTITLMR